MKKLVCVLAAALAALPAQAQPTQPAAPTASLLGAVLNVADPDKVIAFYRDGLGMNLAMTLSGSHGIEYMMSFGGNPSQPGIILQKDPALALPLTAGSAFNRLVLRVSDLDAVTARLESAGYASSPIRDVAQGYRMMMVSDPEGHWLELVQSKPRN